MIQDLPHACESIAFHFWYRHACAMYVPYTMWLWIDIFVLMMFLRKEDFLASFFCLQWREAWETGLHDAWTFKRRADDEFSAVELQMPCSWMGKYFHLFFRSYWRERLSELKFGELLRRRLREWQLCDEQCFTRFSAFFREKTMTNKGRLCCDLELKKLQPVRQRRDEPQGLEPLQDGWWKCFIHNKATNLEDPTGAVERTLSI